MKRRTVLGAGLGAGAAAALGGCNLVGSGGGETGTGSGGSGSVTIGLVPDPAGASEFYAEQIEGFSQESGISVKIIEYPSDQIRNALELAFPSGDAPDVVRAQGSTVLEAFSSRDWLADLTDRAEADGIIDRLGGAEAMDPQTSGLHVDGKLMSLPLVSRKWANGPLIWNRALFAKAGLDAPPTTWTEFEQFARELTKAGAGDFFGFSPGSETAYETKLLQAQGGPNSIQRYALDLIEGKAAEADPSSVEPVEMFRRMQADKVFQPGWESWSGNRIAQEFAKEKLAMGIVGNWLVNESLSLNPELDLGVADIPVPDTGRKGYFAKVPFQPIWSMSATAKDPDASWELMKFLVSDGFQRGYFEKFRSFTAVDSAWESGNLTEAEQQLSDVLTNGQKASPDLRLGGEAQLAIITALTAEQAINDADGSPQAITRNQPFQPMAEQRDAMREEALEKIFADLKADGIDASREDLTFPDWDPMTDWTPAG
ncbi:ABC transporter substrate-binding protein [Propionibacteriaceae bacterium Y2011]|uniref:ABC transporter substrate-binding protein n=1 Tax=Microlunatus sp. Y2014 TaxID=3418488 RepID=UPI003D4834B8